MVKRNPSDRPDPAQPDSHEDFYRSLFWNLNAIVVVFDPETTRILDATRTACEFYGYTREELLERSLPDLTLAPYQLMRARIERVLAGGHESLLQQHRLATGAVRDLEVLPELTVLGNRPAIAAVMHDVTERLMEERAHQEHLQKFDVIFNHLPVGAVTIRPVMDAGGGVIDAVIEDANLAAAVSLGGEAQALCGQAVSAVWPAGVVAPLLEMCREVCGKGDVARREISLAEPQRWYELLVAGITRELFALTAVDTTAHTLAERKLRQREEELRNILDAIPGQISIMLPDGSFDFFNRAFLGYVRQPLEQMIGDGWMRTVHPEDLMLLRKAWKPAEQPGGPAEIELRIRGADWTYRWFLRRALPVLTPEGKPARWVVLDVDITERKQAEAAAANSEENMRRLFRISVEAILTSGMDGRIHAANAAAAVMFGWSEAELLEKRLADLVDDADGKLQAALTEDDNQATFTGEMAGLRRDGNRFHVDLNATGYLDVDGNLRSGIFIRDITDRKALEANLEAHIQKLNETTGELQRLVAHLEKSRRDADLLRQVGEYLQVCLDEEEAYGTIRLFSQRLFPKAGCGLFLAGGANRQVETAAAWGPALASETVFGFADCWALRRGRLFQANHTRDLKCAHMDAHFSGSYLELPLTAAGETIGLLHLEWPDDPGGALENRDAAVILADNAALSLANLRLRHKLQQQTAHDLLTGVYNRRTMDELLAQKLRTRPTAAAQPFCLVMVDIDQFKEINERAGHPAADSVLVELVKLLRGQARAEDILCRYSGDEFMLLLENTGRDAALEWAETLRAAVEHKEFLDEGRRLGRVTVSVGLAAYPQQGLNAGELIRALDRALTAAKKNGRNRVEMSL